MKYTMRVEFAAVSPELKGLDQLLELFARATSRDAGGRASDESGPLRSMGASLLAASDGDDFDDRLAELCLADTPRESGTPAMTFAALVQTLDRLEKSAPRESGEIVAVLAEGQTARLATVARAILNIARSLAEGVRKTPGAEQAMNESFAELATKPAKPISESVYDPAIPSEGRQMLWTFVKITPVLGALVVALQRGKRLDPWLVLRLVGACEAAFQIVVRALLSIKMKQPMVAERSTSPLADWFAAARANNGRFSPFVPPDAETG